MMVPVRQKPVDFKILSNVSTDLLAADIIDYLKKGWVFHGEISQFSGKLCQAMVKIETERMDIPGSNILVPQMRG